MAYGKHPTNELIKLIMGGENFKVDKLLKLKIKYTIFISIFFVIF